MPDASPSSLVPEVVEAALSAREPSAAWASMLNPVGPHVLTLGPLQKSAPKCPAFHYREHYFGPRG